MAQNPGFCKWFCCKILQICYLEGAKDAERPSRNRTARQRLECAELAPALECGERLESAGKPDALQTLREIRYQENASQPACDFDYCSAENSDSGLLQLALEI